MWSDELKDIDHIQFGDTKYRLAESDSGGRVIQLWSNLSKQWVISSRVNVDARWRQMKVFYESMAVKRN